MSFTKTVSTIAALASIFGTSVLAYKLVQNENQQPSGLEEKITQLEKQLEEAKSQRPVVKLVQETPPVAPEPIILPEVTQPPPVPEE
jgi:hypothetical protein